MISEPFRKKLKKALKLELDYFEKGSRWEKLREDFLKKGETKDAAVVLLLAGQPNREEASILLTKRAESLVSHRGQMAFPGGVLEDSDHQDSNQTPAITAAVRELEEEVGVSQGEVEVFGALPQAFTYSSRFWVTPVIAACNRSLEEVKLNINPAEIDRAYWISLAELDDPNVYRQEWIRPEGIEFKTHVFQVGQDRVWGATAAMLRNLLDRLNHVESL